MTSVLPRRTAGPRVVELPRDTERRRRTGDVRHHPVDAAVRPTPIPGHARRARPDRPASVIAEMTYRPPAVHTGIGCRSTTVADVGRRSSGVRRRVPRLGLPRGRRGIRATGRRAARRALACGLRAGDGAMLTPAIYRTRITHLRRAPGAPLLRTARLLLVRRPRQPAAARGWLRPFAKFDARDHFSTPAETGPDATRARRRLPRRTRHQSAGRHRHRADAGPGARISSSTR